MKLTAEEKDGKEVQVVTFDQEDLQLLSSFKKQMELSRQLTDLKNKWEAVKNYNWSTFRLWISNNFPEMNDYGFTFDDIENKIYVDKSKPDHPIIQILGGLGIKPE